VVRVGDREPFVIADMPGLIEGAHKGTGLGIKFLRHIERTRILVHLIDVMSIDPDNPLDAYDIINNELSSYSRTLSEKPQIVTLTKLDIQDGEDAADSFRSAVEELEVESISAVTGQGIDRLKARIVQLLDRLDES